MLFYYIYLKIKIKLLSCQLLWYCDFENMLKCIKSRNVKGIFQWINWIVEACFRRVYSEMLKNKGHNLTNHTELPLVTFYLFDYFKVNLSSKKGILWVFRQFFNKLVVKSNAISALIQITWLRNKFAFSQLLIGHQAGYF